jgi:hypothetical protein
MIPAKTVRPVQAISEKRRRSDLAPSARDAARYGAIAGPLRERHKTKSLHRRLGHDLARPVRRVALSGIRPIAVQVPF